VSSVTDLVVSRIVRSPMTSKAPSPRSLISVDSNRIVGKFSTSKKSPERRWLSRSVELVVTEAVSIDTSTWTG
jgi:hypothetical protein